jgi:hypothetical protein
MRIKLGLVCWVLLLVVTLKLVGIISWSWKVVLIPLYVELALQAIGSVVGKRL